MEARKKFLAASLRQGWAQAPGIVCALSGGGDSVAMLYLMKEYFRGKVAAAHLDHCTRNGESHHDAEFARRLCGEWNIPCYVKTVEVHESRQTGESFEMAGRRARYEHFEETAKLCGYDFIAVAHNADDVVETQLLNLARGTGIPGLRGIPERRGNIVRPVIDFSREELRKLLREAGVKWCDDYTNDESDYMRNKVRNLLIPWIRENLNAGFDKVMLGLAKQASEETTEKEAEAAALLDKTGFELAPALAAWHTDSLPAVSAIRLKEMLRLQGVRLSLPVLSRERTELLLSLIRRGGKWRFQWARDIEVCYSQRGIGWLHRADIEKNAADVKNKEKAENAEIAENDKKAEKTKNIIENKLPWWAR